MTTQISNIAESCKSHYESDDFKQNYACNLFEDTHAVQERIIQYLKEYEIEKRYGNPIDATPEQAEEIYLHILENIEEFTSNYSGYYVGYTSLDSVEFGEQEEQISGFDSDQGTPEAIKQMFLDADYVINDSSPDYAYYIVDGGLHVDLLAGDLTELFKKLNLL